LLAACGGADETDAQYPIDEPELETTACAGDKQRLGFVANSSTGDLPLKGNVDPEAADCKYGDFICFADLVVYCRDNFGQVECDAAGCSCYVC